MRLGLIARVDSGGLAWQSLALTRMLRPAKVMIIDSRPFNGASVKQYPGRFEGYAQLITSTASRPTRNATSSSMA